MWLSVKGEHFRNDFCENDVVCLLYLITAEGNYVSFDQNRTRSTSKSIQGEFNPMSCQNHKQKVNMKDRKANMFIVERLLRPA